MPKKKKSSPAKTIFIVVIALLVGAGLMFAFLFGVGKKANKEKEEQQQKITEKEQIITRLAPQVDQAFVTIVKLAEEKNLEAAAEAGNKALSQIDEIMTANQEIIDEVEDKPKEIALKRQEVFATQKKALEKLTNCTQIEDIESPEGKACQEEFIQLTQNLQAKLQEFKELTGTAEPSGN